MLRRFADSGASDDFCNKRVCIPNELVGKSLEQAGKKFATYGRDVSKEAAFGAGKRNYNSIAGEALWVDNLGESRRQAK